ncbi:type IX secretion system motor protein PorM/GldM [Arcicella rigui]|uniref:Gliding motility protein GldM n=1 Tax=Arcicella rigui TaxID=797020 RepID=A0ABU5Q4Y1_9BACT|nr:gliding motility protein GldM [Arcicella rigui]MEA5137667.1 gliding motility protein GldM [Arcicella rigui]
MKETPRQKMIGMMYLVLTALLALQVSDALLQKFVLLNNSLEAANSSAVQKNNQTVEGIKAKVNDSPNPAQYADIIRQASEVRKLSDAMVSELDNLKSVIIEKSGGVDPETGTLVGMKETEKVYEVMIGGKKDGLAYDLKTKLDNFVIKISSYSDKSTKFTPLALSGSEDPAVAKDANNKNKDFAELNFAETPVPAALATLSQKQSEVRRYESTVLGQLAEKVGIKDIKFDKILAMVSAKSNTVVAGMDYEAEMFIAAYSSGITPRMSFNGTGVPVRDGKGQIKFKAQGGQYDSRGLSRKTYTASISFNGPNGPETRTLDQEYFVLKPTYNIEAGSLPPLYLGCANKLSIVSPGLGALWQPSFSANGAEVISAGGGKVTVVPSSASVELNVTNGGILLGTEKFRVRKVPRPDVKIFGGGGELDEKRGASASGLRSVEARAIADESFKATNPEDAQYRVSEIYVALARGSKKISDITLPGGGSISSLAQNAQAGDRYYIEIRGVQRKNFKGVVENIPFQMIKNIPLN